MRTIRKKLEHTGPAYPVEQIAPLEQVLFLDIETTGFTAKNSCVYLIGCVYYENEEWRSIQWFADNYEKEREVINAFFKFAKNYTHLIHFNGNNFDLPFLSQKCAQYALPYSFDAYKGIDLYKRTAPCRRFLKLPDCKQKTVEKFLNLEREDPFGGGELISVYHSYAKDRSDLSYHAILLHNQEDLQGMLSILPILSYSDLFLKPIKTKKVQANHYKDMEGNSRQELIMKLSLPSPLPRAVSFGANGCYFTGNNASGSLKIPLFEEEMKYFYSNYKDYYYLPQEDTAIHKSVAAYVDKPHRTQASAATCYTRKHSLFLPQWDTLFLPFFKRDYNSRELFFELTEELKTNREAFHKYAAHVLGMMTAVKE